ncbi:UNVERIFIED_CONTAM: hypothetical protein K2H54_042041, partial [Gekko kuhli]
AIKNYNVAVYNLLGDYKYSVLSFGVSFSLRPPPQNEKKLCSLLFPLSPCDAFLIYFKLYLQDVNQRVVVLPGALRVGGEPLAFSPFRMNRWPFWQNQLMHFETSWVLFYTHTHT